MSTHIAPAKLTWFLEITGTRDDGLHNLRAEMVSLELADELVIDKSGDYLNIEGHYSGISAGPDNLVNRALKLVGRTAGVTLRKSIPPGGGLGGGSSDAGAILRWAGGVSDEEALTLGGDVPFCQLGGRALVEGAGEIVTGLPFEEREVTLILLDFGVDTGLCYLAYDEMINEGRKPTGRNELEEAACRAEPRLRSTMDWLKGTLGQSVHLAGSGSTLFVEGHLEAGVDNWDVTGPEGFVQFRQTKTTPR